MKQTRDGKRVTNWHRPLPQDAFKSRYLRKTEEDPPDFDNEDYYDDDHPEWGAEDVEVMLWDLMQQLEVDRVLERTGSPFAAVDVLSDLNAGPSDQDEPREIETIPPETLIDDLHEFLTFFLRKYTRDRRVGRGIAGIAKIDTSEMRSADRQILLQVLEDDPDHTSALIGMVIFSRYWIRWPADFWEDDYPADLRLVDKLGLHLFARHEIPPSLIGAWRGSYEWSSLSAQCICWYLLLAQGASQHKAAKKFDWDIGKKFTSCLFRVPADTPTERAPYVAECLRLGAPLEVAQRIAASECFGIVDLFWNGSAREQRAKTFWQGYVLWITRHLNEIEEADIDVIWHWSYHRFIEAERIEEEFSMTGRSSARVLEEARDYIRQIRVGWRVTENLAWNAKGWNWNWEDPDKDDAPVWTISELTSSDELREEGKALHHCVGSYSRACAENRAAIFSMRCQDWRVATIEIRVHNREIAQARGSCNRALTPREQSVLKMWHSEKLLSSRKRKSDD